MSKGVAVHVNNPFKVQKHQWNKWGYMARRTFNQTYDMMLGDQKLFLHPKAATIDEDHWKTTAWNAAWTAADAVQDALEGL